MVKATVRVQILQETVVSSICSELLNLSQPNLVWIMMVHHHKPVTVMETCSSINKASTEGSSQSLPAMHAYCWWWTWDRVLKMAQSEQLHRAVLGLRLYSLPCGIGGDITGISYPCWEHLKCSHLAVGCVTRQCWTLHLCWYKSARCASPMLTLVGHGMTG